MVRDANLLFQLWDEGVCSTNHGKKDLYSGDVCFYSCSHTDAMKRGGKDLCSILFSTLSLFTLHTSHYMIIEMKEASEILGGGGVSKHFKAK